jgi:16S rRNA (cytosine967-C5)-methyltransferase
VADARRVALDVLLRIDVEGAYANLALDPILRRARLDARDVSFATELVYGTTRMRRACDFLIDRFVMRKLDPPTRNVLRLGAYQLHYLRVPAHAAVSATVAVAPSRSRGLVNAVLRRVSEAPVDWPDQATRLSYPDWVVDRLVDDQGPDDAVGALERMNEAPTVVERADGYVQDTASQWVVEHVGAAPGELVLDLCAAPGGKATALAATGATVVAADIHRARAGLVVDNAARLGVPLAAVCADGTSVPFGPASFDRVLVDAPCSGLGVLGRRADARWRIEEAAVDRLAALQRRLLGAVVSTLRPGGTLVYSVCTLTKAETVEIDEWLSVAHPQLTPLPSPHAPWRPLGRGAELLPQAAGTDGMSMFRYRL